MVEAHRNAVDFTSEPQDLAALLLATRAAYQANLLETAQARKQLGLDLKAVRANAEQDSLAFEPDGSVIARLTQAWATYGELANSPADRSAAPQSLEEARDVWSTTLQRCSAELERFHRDHDAWANTRTGLFRRAPSEPRLPRSFQADLHTLRQISEAVPAVRDAFVQGIEGTAVPRLRATFESEAAAREQRLMNTIQSNLSAVEMGVELLGLSGQTWDRRLTEPVELSTSTRAAARLGTISSGLPAPYSVDVPA